MGKEPFERPIIVRVSTSLEERLERLRIFPNVAEIIEMGQEKFKRRFLRTLYDDMKEVGYDIDELIIKPGKNSRPSKNKYISLVERGLKSEIEQYNISQGMWRTLSLIAHINLMNMMKKTGCILIDDIGEGLDYDRSTLLIKLLIKKAKKSDIQLIMTTNDRFTMNNVPLEYWSVIERSGGVCKVYNYKNSKQISDDFEFTGLSNFDFFSTRYFLKKTKTR